MHTRSTIPLTGSPASRSGRAEESAASSGSIFSPNVASLRPSSTMMVANRAKERIAAGEDVIDLCVGEPDFPTPSFIAEAGIRAIREGKTRYTSPAGIAELREAVAAELSRLSATDVQVDPAGVVISAGAKQALFNTIFSVFGPGDRVLIPVPHWTTYPALVELARAEPVFVRGSGPASKVAAADLEEAAGSGVAGLILNSPCNPTGAVYSRDELEDILGWAADRRVWVVSDEMYRRIRFGEDGIAPGVLDLPQELLDRVVLVDGASKAYAMTGWRLGFSYTTPALAAKAIALQSQTTSNVTTPTQWAALAAYTDREAADGEIERMRSAFQRRRDLLVELFRSRLPGVSFVEPEGAFYFWLGVEGLAKPGEGSMALCERLLEEAGLAVVPGAAFGDDEHIRISFAYDEATLREGVRRLASLA